MWCFYRRHQAENHSYVNDTTLPNIQSQELQREMSRLSVDGCSPGPTHLKVILRELLFTDQGSIHRELLHDQGHSSRSAQNLGMASLKLLISKEALRECRDLNYHQILPIIAEKVHQEKVQQEKLKAVKARLNFEETSRHSESGTPIKRRGLKERLGPRYVRSRSRSPEPRHDRPESPKKKGPERKAMFKRLEKGVFHRLGNKRKSVSVHSDDSRRWSHHSSRRDTESYHQSSRSRATGSAPERRYNKRASSRRTKELSESEGSAGGHWKSKLKRQKHIKTYDGSEDPEDHLKIFQFAAKTERRAMPTWCHMFSSTLTRNVIVWFDDLPKETIDSYDNLKKAFLENYLQQKKCIKDPVAASNRERKKSFPLWKQQEANQKQNFKKGGFRNQQRSKRKQDWFALLTKTPKEIFTLGKGKFKAPPPMTTPIEKRNASKFCEFHGEVGHNTDELARQKITQSFSPNTEISFPPLDEDEGTEGPMIIEAEIGGHCIHRMYVDGGSASEILLVPLECAMVSGPEGTLPATNPIVEERIKVAINPEYPEQTVMIPSTLTEEGRNKLCSLLQRNLDIFSWKPADMTGVPRHIAEHRLNVQEGCSPVRQKKRGQAADRNQAIQEEVGKLVEAGIMREVHYHDWLSNPVMVKKHDDSWRMCVDFKDLNKACLKDGYLLPEIDWKVESLCGFPFKNAGATYQRLVDKAFHKNIGRNLEVYVDDIVIKSRTEDEIVRDIEETFKTLREINMKLNPKKCTFGVDEGMFLGYKVNTKGLKVCPDKVDAVLSLSSPKCLKDVQKLNGKLASLNRFLAKSAEKSLPLFKTLKRCTKKSDFHWTTEAEEAFKQMKQLIAELHMLMAPMEKEELIVYLAATKEMGSAILMTKREAKQMPIYFVSRALRGPEINYTSMEKLILSRPEVAGRLQKWSIELGEYSIHYRPRVLVKGQILADFIVERPEEDSPNTPIEVEEKLHEPWILFMDGSSCTDGSRAGLILTNPEGMEFTYTLRFRFDAINNEAEYEALIAGLRIVEEMGVKNLQANVDSRLVANQVTGTYVAKEIDMIHYLEKVKALTGSFKAFTIKQIPRSKNKKADALSKIDSTSFTHLSKQILVEELKEKSIREVEVLAVVEEERDTWMTPIFKYLAKEILPTDMNKARAIRRKSWRFAVINGILYKKSFLGPWLRFGLPKEIISDNGK
ncbi:reverse transcriptase domain-containing protein [Tanacetum coccineum]